MSLPVFEIACLAIVVVALAALARRRPLPSLLPEYAALATAAWLGEQSCILAYRFYEYAPGWHGRAFEVPILVPLIWPLVVLSAREVVSELWPRRRGWRFRALAVGAVVAFDASLVEVLAVRAGLWRWAEPGHLGVPLIGVLGWGFFAAAAERSLSLAGARRWIVVGAAPLGAHLGIVAAWWGLLRWTLRGDLGVASSVGVGLIGVAATALVLRARAAGGAIPVAVAAPRMIAAALFVALFLSTAPNDARLWAHLLSIAAPYVAATRFLHPSDEPAAA